MSSSVFIMLGVFAVLSSGMYITQPVHASSSIGVSPAGIINHELLSPQTADYTVEISRSDTTVAEQLNFAMSESIADIVSISTPNDELIIDEGDSRLPVTVHIDTDQIAQGEYEGTIAFSFVAVEDESSDSEDDANVSNSSQVYLDVDLTITNTEKEEYTVTQVSLETTEEESDVVATMHVDNTGNVKAGPSDATIDFYPLDSETVVETQNIDLTENADPFTSVDLSFSIPNTLPIGQYRAVIELFDNTESVFETESTVDVVEKGSIKKKGILDPVEVDETQQLGSTHSIQGTFENTGEGVVIGKMVNEVYFDDQLIDTLTSEEAIIEEGDDIEFSNPYRAEKPGEYRVQSYVTFSGRHTEYVNSTFTVVGPSAARTAIVVGGIGLFTVLIILLTIYIIRMINKKDRSVAFPVILSGVMVILSVGVIWSMYRFYSKADTSSTSATVNNASPTASAVSVSGGAASITLAENTLTEVTITATVTDNNGCEDITDVDYVFYRTDLPAGTGCLDDANNCYTGSCTVDGGSCTAGGADLIATYTCTANVDYYADATDASSSRASTDWTAEVTPSDAGGVGSAATDTIEMASLAALNVTATIPYGTLSLNADSMAQTVSITNTGNVRTDTNISGTALTCTVGTIAATQQKFDTSVTSYDSLVNTLSTSTTEYDFDIAQRTGASTPYDTYWILRAPTSGVSGSCTGSNTFTAVNDDVDQD